MQVLYFSFIDYLSELNQMRQGISSRVSKVNQELDKLATIITDNTNLYFQAKQALQVFQKSCQSSDSQEFNIQISHYTESNGFSTKKSDILNIIDPSPDVSAQGTTKSGSKSIAKHSHYENYSKIERPDLGKSIDTTIKKFNHSNNKHLAHKKPKNPIENPGKKEKKQKYKGPHKSSKPKNNTKLKSPKSDHHLEPFMNLKNKDKTDSYLRKTKKRVIPLDAHPLHLKPKKKHSNAITLNSNSRPHPLSISMFPEQNISTEKIQKVPQCKSANQSNLHEKLQLNLKKEVTMKITDLNIQKQLCQRESEYLKASMRFSSHKLLEICEKLESSVCQQMLVKGFVIKTLVKFLAQFFHPQQFEGLYTIYNDDDITIEQLTKVLKKQHFLKYMLKLPTILNENNTLCQKNCIQLFQEKRFIERKLCNFKNLENDMIIIYFNSLYEYISFLLNNNMVHQTKRKQIPFEFHSERSHKQLQKGILSSLEKNQHLKEYDSERKKSKHKAGLKRVKTYKVLSKNKSTPHESGKMKRIIHSKY